MNGIIWRDHEARVVETELKGKANKRVRIAVDE
jgi:hypothetical protein